MGSITPRWEWRTFDQDFGDVESWLRQRPSERRESFETYILSANAHANTKLRDQKLDIKALQQLDPHGLELWLPVMKADFPLTTASVHAAFAAWNVAPPALAAGPWTVQAFFEDLVGRQPALTSIGVAKTRYGLIIDDCIVELADLTFDGTPIRTIAVEMADPVRVWKTVEALGLSSRENVNYVKALKRFLASRTAPAHAAPGRARL